MKNNDKRLEKFVDKLMADAPLEQPSLDFTAQVMSKVEALSTSKAIQYKPLIPKYMWWLIGAVCLGVVAYVYLTNPEYNFSVYETLGINPIEFKGVDITFPKTTMYAVALLAVMLLIQIPVLKHYVNKRMVY